MKNQTKLNLSNKGLTEQKNLKSKSKITKENMKNFYSIITIFLTVATALFLIIKDTSAANYPLEIINIDEVGEDNRIKFAYPGIEYKVVIAAFGGTYPFNWELLDSPVGMVIDSSTGEIIWNNPSIGGTVEVRVIDSEGSVDVESYEVLVTNSTDRFLFVDVVNGYSLNEGSIDSPFRLLDDFWLSDHSGKIIYLRSGIYNYPKNGRYNDRTIHRVALDTGNPMAFLGYPNESIILDGENNGAESFCWYMGYPDHYFYNLIFNDIYYYGMAISGASNYLTVYNCTFTNTYSDSVHANQASINFMAGPAHNKLVIFGNTFSNHQSGSSYHGIETYDLVESVIQDNTFNATGNCGVFIKGTSRYIAIRHNVFNGPTSAWYGGIDLYGGSGHHDIEVSFNLFKNDEKIFLRTNPPAPLAGINIFRNTILTKVTFRNEAFTGDVYGSGEITMYDNIIQSSLSDSGSAPGSFVENHIDYSYISVTDYNTLIAGMSDNLIGASGIVDENGMLTSEYQQYVGSRGWQTLTVSDTTPPTLSSPIPTGELPNGTTSTTISTATNETSTCKYSTVANTTYASMTNTMTDTSGTHSATVSNLTNGSTYNYYVRCSDSSGNVNTTDYPITFSISNEVTRADVDNSSTINTTDAMLTLRNSLGLDMSQTSWQTSDTTGDVDCNNITNSTDAMLILRYSLGLSMDGTGWCI